MDFTRESQVFLVPTVKSRSFCFNEKKSTNAQNKQDD